MASQSELQRKQITNWIEGIRSRHRVEIPEIASRARVSSSTIYRWFDQKHPFNASMTSLSKIANAFETSLPSAEDDEPLGFADGEAQQVLEKVEALKLDNNNQGVWRLRSRALELAGYLPGDLLLVDMTVQPRTGDVVAAQVYNFERGTAETRLRVFEAPFLTTRTMDPAAHERPLFVDNDRVHLAGTVVRSLRVRS